MLMMNMVCLGIVPIIWNLYGYSLSSTGTGNGFIGTFDNVLMRNVAGADLRDVFFALTFAMAAAG